MIENKGYAEQENSNKMLMYRVGTWQIYLTLISDLPDIKCRGCKHINQFIVSTEVCWVPNISQRFSVSLPTASASPRGSLEMHVIKPGPRFSKSETWGFWAKNVCFNKTFGSFQWTLKFEIHCYCQTII